MYKDDLIKYGMIMAMVGLGFVSTIVGSRKVAKEIEKDEDRIRTQWKVKSTGELLNKKNIDEKIRNATNEKEKQFYEYLKAEFLT